MAISTKTWGFFLAFFGTLMKIWDCCFWIYIRILNAICRRFQLASHVFVANQSCTLMPCFLGELIFYLSSSTLYQRRRNTLSWHALITHSNCLEHCFELSETKDALEQKPKSPLIIMIDPKSRPKNWSRTSFGFLAETKWTFVFRVAIYFLGLGARSHAKRS